MRGRRIENSRVPFEEDFPKGRECCVSRNGEKGFSPFPGEGSEPRFVFVVLDFNLYFVNKFTEEISRPQLVF